jgi:hypothetical protein
MGLWNMFLLAGFLALFVNLLSVPMVVVRKSSESEISGCVFENAEETVCCQGCTLNIASSTWYASCA